MVTFRIILLHLFRGLIILSGVVAHQLLSYAVNGPLRPWNTFRLSVQHFWSLA